MHRSFYDNSYNRQMASSLTSLPTLRRTLTDIMEDELYHVPAGSPLLSVSKRPFSQSNEDLLMIPDQELQHVQPFNEYADPNLVTTTHPFYPYSTVDSDINYSLPLETLSPRDAHLKIPQELLFEQSNGEAKLFGTDADQSHFYVWPMDTMLDSDKLSPAELFARELSEDEDDDDDDDIMDEYNHQDDYQFEECDKEFIPLDGKAGELGTPKLTKKLTGNLDGEMDVDVDVNTENVSMENVSMANLNMEMAPQNKGMTQSQQMKMENGVYQPISIHLDRGAISPPSEPTEVPLKPLSNQQDNPHKCYLINPSTHKPCLKQFSRPYDLIRHQETIHASRKKLFRCRVCEEEALVKKNGVKNFVGVNGEKFACNKTFGRGDALSRHIRVKHLLSGQDALDVLQHAKDHVEYVDN